MSASRHPFPVAPAPLSVGPLAAEAAGDSCSSRLHALRLMDALDLAQSQLDEAEQLFCAGHTDAGLRSVGDAIRTLEGVE